VNALNTGRTANGRSWRTAYPTVQQALQRAKAGDEIWVAKGTYKPTSGTDRTASFRLKARVGVYAGFAGAETRRDQRDWWSNVTVLSGDLGKAGDNSDNSYHVVVGADGAVLDGFAIVDGNGFGSGGRRPASGRSRGRSGGGGQTHTTPQNVMSGPSYGQGAGMVNYQCAPTVRNCAFRNNRAFKGGGMYNMVSKRFPPGRGGRAEPAPKIVNCTFISNYALGRGGAVSNDLGTHPTFTSCTFFSNVCDGKGGAMYNDFGCSPTVTNCLFAGNAAYRAGAMGNDGSSCPTITNCTFTRNRATDFGAALYQGTGPANNPMVTNCILWGNLCDNGPAGIVNWHHSNPSVTDSCVQGGCPGKGNIDADPKFVAPDKGDYRLSEDSPCPRAGYSVKAARVPSRKSPTARRLRMGQGKPSLRPTSKLRKQTVVRVSSANTNRKQDGRSWRTAYRALQKGIDHAWRSSGEVWVAQGTYKPTDKADRSASFQMRYGVAVYGGFAGRETRRSQRDWQKNVAVLSGDAGAAGDASDNCYHVLIGCDKATLDGLTITGGNADGRVYDGKGGGMINYRRDSEAHFGRSGVGYSPVVVNCTFTSNRAIEGGAVYSYDRGTPVFTNCTFTGNSADNGGAILDRVGVKATVTGCTFTANHAKWRGGAMYFDYGSRPTVTNCTFRGNTSGCHGGALFMLTRSSQLEHTVPTVRGCTFEANTARKRGGAIGNTDKCILALSDCTFTRNRAGTGGGALANDYLTHATVTKCVFKENTADKGKADIDTDSTSTVTTGKAVPQTKQDKPRSRFQGPLAYSDKNGDGKISRGEAPSRMKAEFSRIDTNRDGFVSPDEIRKHHEGRRRGGRRRGF